ncbi:glycosyl transferase [Spirochaetia bacterium]|nr:glycosyl transferase [Spirochaetia bacterium]
MTNDYSVLMLLWYKEKPEYLRASLESMVRQTIPPSEYVFVQDHDIPSELTSVIKSNVGNVSVKYVDAYDLFGKGFGSLLARGIEHCSYELIARMDSDDIAFSDRCERQLAVFKENPQLAVVGGTIAEFSDTPEEITSYRVVPEKNHDIIKFAKYRCPFNQPSVMFRKTVIINVGNYNTSYSACEDYELWYRVLKSGGVGYNIPEPILYFRAGEDLIKRRGKKDQYLSFVAIKKRMRNDKFINWFDFQFSVNIQRFFYYSPFFIQKWMYRYFLRKNI